LLHNHWLTRYDLDGLYVPLPVQPGELRTALIDIRHAKFRGANVTVPYKVDVAQLCDDLCPAALRTGAVNTLVFDSGRVIGDNTDGAGFIANLLAHGVAPGPALLLGAGGAARAIADALLAEGVPVTIANRTPARSEAMAALMPELTFRAWEDRHDLRGLSLLVNTTTLGMTGQPPLDIDLSGAPPGLAVCDIVYTPLETPLMADARARGLAVVGGLGMLLHQAVVGFTAWFGHVPTVDAETYDLVAAGL
jgi:shikimate dehydrogenase